jgi:hypothetical protein
MMAIGPLERLGFLSTAVLKAAVVRTVLLFLVVQVVALERMVVRVVLPSLVWPTEGILVLTGYLESMVLTVRQQDLMVGCPVKEVKRLPGKAVQVVKAVLRYLAVLLMVVTAATVGMAELVARVAMQTIMEEREASVEMGDQQAAVQEVPVQTVDSQPDWALYPMVVTQALVVTEA